MNSKRSEVRSARASIWKVAILVGVASISTLSAQAAGLAEGRLTRGAELYGQHCTLCHGAFGGADGLAATLLFPPARDFMRGRFKLAGTENGVPTDADLVATLRRGIPGSAMPSWNWMPEEDLRALAQHVRALAVDGLAQDFARNEGTTADEARDEALRRMTPGTPIRFDPVLEPTADDLERGRRAYLRNCSACHGEDGKGRKEVPRRDEDETLNWARDFTSGVLKGGATQAELTSRIRVGLHGTAMPSASVSLEEQAGLIAYVRSLIPADAVDRLVQRREIIRARRLEQGVLVYEDGVDWDELDEVSIALAPLWWHDGAIVRASVSAAHDGEHVALRIRWKDPIPNAPADLEWPLKAPPYTDAVALQIAQAEKPPFFGMGQGFGATNIWHWRALDYPDTNPLPGFTWLLPHRIGDWLTQEGVAGAPLYRLAQGALKVAGEIFTAQPAGMKVLEQQEELPPVVGATATWSGGEWEVVMKRSLNPREAREIHLRPGFRFALNFAIWNGSVHDLRGQKSVTIWHTLELES